MKTKARSKPRSSRRVVRLRSDVEAGLRAIGVRLMTDEFVEAHKSSITWPIRRNAIGWILGEIAVATVMFSQSEPGDRFFAIVGIALVVVAGLTFLMGVCAALDVTWRRTAIEEYKRDVPALVRGEVSRVLAAEPSATFEVEHLDEEHDHRDSSPFLVATIGKNEFYIEV